jgi:hypothetical protein
MIWPEIEAVPFEGTRVPGTIEYWLAIVSFTNG